MPSLMDKLRMIDSATQVQPRQLETIPKPPEPHGCYRRSDRFPISSFCELRHMSAFILKEIFALDFPRHVQPTDMLFLDTETTGLSGGAGTIAF